MSTFLPGLLQKEGEKMRKSLGLNESVDTGIVSNATDAASPTKALGGIADVVNSESALGGGIKGVTAGLQTGNPVAAVVGGVVGAAAGLLGARKARKKRAAEIKEKELDTIGGIQERSGQQQSNLLLQLGRNLKIT